MKLRWLIRNEEKPKLQELIPSPLKGEDGTWETIETQIEDTKEPQSLEDKLEYELSPGLWTDKKAQAKALTEIATDHFKKKFDEAVKRSDRVDEQGIAEYNRITIRKEMFE